MPITGGPFINTAGGINAVDSYSLNNAGIGALQLNRHLNLNSISASDLAALRDAMEKYSKPRESSTVADESFRMKAIAMRLRLTQGERMPFDHFTTAHSGDKVFAFLVVKGAPIVLEDDSVMFPSDTFMTQIRMLMD